MDIPTAESLKLMSRATSLPDDPPLPKPVVAESYLKRDEWMLEPSVTSITLSSFPQNRSMTLEDGSLTEDYGELSGNARTGTGGVDFFSSLGKERQKKPKSDPAEARNILNGAALSLTLIS